LPNVLINGKKYTLLGFDYEEDFEKAVIENQEFLFGKDTIYIDTKIRIGTKETVKMTIPDGFLIDFTSRKNPQLYFVENELSSHDVINHIGQQMLRFLDAIDTSKAQIRKKLLEKILDNSELFDKVEFCAQECGYNNAERLVSYLTEDKSIKIIIAINEETVNLQQILSYISMVPEVVVMQRYWDGINDYIYIYEPLNDGAYENIDTSVSDENIKDTIVCSALEANLKHTYFDESAWWEVRISQKMHDQLRYFAVYEKTPIAAIRHIAEIDEIVPHGKIGKYKILLKNKRTIQPIKLDKNNSNAAPQMHRYTTYERLIKAKKLSDLWF